MKGNRNSSVGAQEVRRTVSCPEFDSLQGREADHLADSNAEFENDRSCTFALVSCTGTALLVLLWTHRKMFAEIPVCKRAGWVCVAVGS